MVISGADMNKLGVAFAVGVYATAPTPSLTTLVDVIGGRSAPAEHVMPAPISVTINGGTGSTQYASPPGASAPTTKVDEVAVAVTRALYAAGGSDLPNISLERPAQKVESFKRLVSPAPPVAAPVAVSINGGVASTGPSAWPTTAAATPATTCEQDVGWSLKKMLSSMFTPYCQGVTYVPTRVRKPVERSIVASRA